MIDKSYLYEKTYATLARIDLATKTGRSDALVALALRYVVLARMLARRAMEAVLDAHDALRAARRSMKRAEEAGITFALAEARITQLEADYQRFHQEQIELGWIVMDALDRWQNAGATLRDLCNLCNRDYDQVITTLDELMTKHDLGDWRDDRFSALVCTHNLDYKNPRNTGWIDEHVDAPLTHTAKEHMLDIMLHTAEGREAAHEAMEAVFPGIMENALTLVTDVDGVKHLIDKDGVEVGTVGEER